MKMKSGKTYTTASGCLVHGVRIASHVRAARGYIFGVEYWWSLSGLAIPENKFLDIKWEKKP